MSTLKNGILKINGIEIKSNTSLQDAEISFNNANVEVRRRTNRRATLRFLQPIKLGSKNFRVSVAFKNEHIWGIELIVDDPNIGEWDYEEMLAQHGDWLVEQIGHPEGILSENVYEWGKITQWHDHRSCTAGISILYFQG